MAFHVYAELDEKKIKAFFEKELKTHFGLWLNVKDLCALIKIEVDKNPQMHYSFDEFSGGVNDVLSGTLEICSQVVITEELVSEEDSGQQTPLVKKSETENTEPGDGVFHLTPIEGNSQSSDEDAERQVLLARPISEMNFSVRVRKCMIRLGINTFGDLINQSADDLLERCKNFGMVALNEVREKLHHNWNLKLKGD